MLQQSLLSDIVDALTASGIFTNVKFGNSNVPPKKTDGGLKGVELASSPVIVENDSGVLKVSTNYFTIAAGTAQEVVFFGADGEAKDRTLIQPITGGAHVKVAVEYYLEPLANG